MNFNLFVLSILIFWIDVEAQPQQQQTGTLLLFNHTTATLSEGRAYLAATSSGELVLFAGGWNATEQASARVDILNVSSGI
jgi:hypothetical protein